MQVSDMHVMDGSRGKVRAFLKVTTDEGFIIDGFRVIDGSSGVFVGWPSKEAVINGEKQYVRTVRIDDKELFGKINEKILMAYYSEVSSRGGSISKPKPKPNNWSSRGASEASKIADGYSNQYNRQEMKRPDETDSSKPTDWDDMEW